MTRYIAAVLLAAPMCLARADTQLRDNFDTPNWSTWCPCQIKMEITPVRLHPDIERTANHIMRITVDEASIGGNDCLSGKPERECRIRQPESAGATSDSGEDIDTVPDMPESLGPSLVRRGVTRPTAQNRYCTKRAWELVRAAGQEMSKRCIQRQELRLQKTHRHDASRPHRYAFRFRMPSSIENRTDSVRWVIAQWKHTSVNKAYKKKFGKDWGPSPFLATRFDNGVLHVTVQDEHCRCKVASAPYPDGTNPKWTDGVPPYCESTRKGDPPGTACRPAPALRARYGTDPVLTPPLGEWVEMSYRAQADRTGKAFIEVYEGGRFIVQVSGQIGYEPQAGEKNMTKFKIGHYRDFMPFVHAMDIDWLEVRPLPN